MNPIMKLGRKAVKRDSRTPRLARYFTSELPAAPASVDWTKGLTDLGMMVNDQLGCCTIAGVGHAIQIWTANASKEVTVSDSSILQYYEQWDGYVPSDPSSDQGGIELDVLTKWKNSDFSGHKLSAFGTISPTNLEHVRQAINLFGGVYIGMMIPDWLGTLIGGGGAIPEVWDYQQNRSQANEGHCVYVVGYDASTICFVSWGTLYRMTISFWTNYVDELYGLVSPDWIESNGQSPCGFNLDQLIADVAQIT